MDIEDPADTMPFPIKIQSMGAGTVSRDGVYEKQFYNFEECLSLVPEKVPTKHVPSTALNISDIARVVRSENSRPFDIRHYM